MTKIIHYCWFGKKPLPKLARKCIKSWQKYLPDYEIKRWDESNFDVNMTEFSKEAYEAGKWAFVADVARIYALKKYGGIYLDTDMLLTKNIDHLLEDEVFVGWESKDYVAVGVLGVRNPNNELINRLWGRYNQLSFQEDSALSLSIPKILTQMLKKEYGLENDHLNNQRLRNGVKVYSRDYFYPLSYDHKDQFFTENTCMIHYYDASWISKPEKRLIGLYRILGTEKGEKMINFLRSVKSKLKRIAKIILFPVVKVINIRRHNRYLRQRELKLSEELSSMGEGKNIVICNPEWLGITYATREMFENVLGMEEIHSTKYLKSIASTFAENSPNMIIFSGLAVGWDKLARQIKELNPDIRIKTLWHGSNSMHLEEYDWARFKELFSLYKDGVTESLGFVKKSMADFYKAKGYKAEFVMNTLSLDKSKYPSFKKKDRESVKIGLYASGDRWVKNFYNQLAATSLVKDAEVECIPISNKVYEFAELIELNVIGKSAPIAREELLQKMRKNDINIYVTFVECAPMLPLESFELGVPCITGNNHHYWEGHELRDYIVVQEADNVMAIYEKIKFCLENKEKILDLYQDWKRGYDEKAHVSLEKFLY